MATARVAIHKNDLLILLQNGTIVSSEKTDNPITVAERLQKIPPTRAPFVVIAVEIPDDIVPPVNPALALEKLRRKWAESANRDDR